MSHRLQLDPRTYDRALSCVHCGLCLPACPTYLQTGHEAESPRGRIQLMRGLSDGKIAPTESVVAHLDACLDCRACETACPSNVVYHELLEETRDRLAKRRNVRDENALVHWMVRHVLTHPDRLKMMILSVRILQRTGLWRLVLQPHVQRALPPAFVKMMRMLPASGRLWPRALPRRMVSEKNQNIFMGARTQGTTVGFLAGCAGSVFFEGINHQSLDLLAACGLNIEVPPGQRCCGAMFQHGGSLDDARKLARRNIDLFLPRRGRQVDFIVTHIAGCGASLKEYDWLLRDDPKYAERARDFSGRVADVTQLLDSLELPAFAHPVKKIVAYHDACHLAHAQKLTAEARRLLAKIPGLVLVPLPESDVCCGAAGTYNLTHSKMAAELAKRKLKNFDASGATALVSGNIGCSLHLQGEARSLGRKLEIFHPVQLLHYAVFG
jgi:glycolate oxidase iron-sulfur subunit